MIVNPDLNIPKEDLDYILEPLPEDKLDVSSIVDNIKEMIIVTVRDSKGNIIEKRKQRMRSLTQNYLAFMSILLLGTFSGASTTTAQSILTGILGLPSQQSTYSSNGAYIFFDIGFQAGSGTQTFRPTISSLSAPISNGSGAGQLEYSSLSVTFGSGGFSFQGVATNGTSSAINVSEIGLTGIIYIGYVDVSSSLYAYNTHTYLLSYDTFSPAISIPAGGSATFQIVISFTG